MRKIYKNVISTILLICIGLYCNCQAMTKKVPDFKKIIHTIDTLTIIPSFVEVKVLGVDNKLHTDTVFSPKLNDTISYMITNLLKKKYRLKQVSGNKKTNHIVARNFNKLFNDLNISKGSISDIEIQDSILQPDNNNSRYCLITVFDGLYSTSEKVRKDTKEVLPASLAVGLLSLGTVMLVPSNPAYLIMRVLLYDRIDKRILYYNSDYIPALNKTDYWRINQLVMNNLKSIYYK